MNEFCARFVETDSPCTTDVWVKRWVIISGSPSLLFCLAIAIEAVISTYELTYVNSLEAVKKRV